MNSAVCIRLFSSLALDSNRKPQNYPKLSKTHQNPCTSWTIEPLLNHCWTTVEPVELLYQDTPPRWAPAVVSGSFQGFGAAQRHQQHEERPRRRRQHRAQALHGAAVRVPVHFGCLGAAPQLMMRTKHFPALSTMNKMWPSRTYTCFQCETVTAEWERIKGCSWFFVILVLFFLFFSLGHFSLLFATFWSKNLYFAEFWS